MKAYKVRNNVWKIEADNCQIIVTEALTDTKGRNVTSVQIIPDNYSGEPKNRRIGGCANVRVVSLKSYNK